MLVYKINESLLITKNEMMSLCEKKKKQKFTISYQGVAGHIADNIINRKLITDGPNKKTTDVSRFNCLFGKVYQFPILDLGSGYIVSWVLSLSPNFEQINRILDKAFKKYPNQAYRCGMAISTPVIKLD